MQLYPSDLTDNQWQFIKDYVNKGRKARLSLRPICNAIFYLLKTGCQWRMLPKHFPKWQRVYYYFQMWLSKGVIRTLQQQLTRAARIKQKKHPEPSAAIVDAQSVKSTLVSSKKHTGYDGGKRIKGIKRTIVVDCSGLLLQVMVHTAGMADRKAGGLITRELRQGWPHIEILYADGSYSLVGQSHLPHQSLGDYALQVVKRDTTQSFAVLPKRWVVERSFAWIETCRRNAKSFERLPRTAEAIIQLSFIQLMLKRLNK